MTALAPNSIFAGQFRIVHLLSQGGFGSVYVAEQAPTGHQRALKVMHAELAQDPRTRERFIQEAQLSAHIESEHVAQVVAAGIDNATGVPWLAMELLHGRDLAALITSRGRIPVGEVFEILRQLGHALAAAHRKGIVHRDLKPENVFVADARRLDAAFTVKVLDFGIARWLREASSAASSAVLGSPLWMAPEQFDTSGQVSPATDVWALGLLAFMMLTGRVFWRSAASMSLPALVGEVTTAAPVRASQRAAELGAPNTLPPNFDDWFARCTHPDVTQRFRDAAEATAAAALAFDERPMHSAALPPTAFPLPGVPTSPQGSMPRTQAVDMSALPFAPMTPTAGSMAWNPGGASPTGVPGAFVPPTGGAGVSPGPFPPHAGSLGAPPGGPVWGLPPAQGGMSFAAPPPTPRKGGGGLAVALVLGLLVVGGGVAAAVVMTQRCGDGEHRSEGHCCREGTDWSRAQRSCVAPTPPAIPVPTAPINPVPIPVQPTPPTPTMPTVPTVPAMPPPADPNTPAPVDPNTPAPADPNTAAPADPTAQTGLHACVGEWRGTLNQGTRNPGQISLNLRGIEGACGQWTEYWSATGARCVYALRLCEGDEGGGIVAKGFSTSNNCVRQVTVRMQCTPTAMSFRETYNRSTDSGTLTHP
jgi:serine/threonine protein kinase